MKKIFIISLLLLSCTIQGTAQESLSKKKIVKTTFWVNGVCEMCQARIQKAALSTKGVKLAKWHIESDQLTVIYKTKQCSLADIKQNIANVGHDCEGFRAPDEVYENLHSCCRYDRDNLPNDIKSVFSD